MLIPLPPKSHRRRVRVKATPANPTPPVNPVYITTVLAGENAADWIFDAELMYVNDISPLKINGASPTSIDFAEDNILRVNYAIFIDIGMPWTYDGSPVAQFVGDGTLQPGSGMTQEG